MPSISAVDVEQLIKAIIAQYANLPKEKIPTDANFQSFAIDSARAVSIMMDLEGQLDLPGELPLELLFEAHSIGQAAQMISEAANKMLSASGVSVDEA